MDGDGAVRVSPPPGRRRPLRDLGRVRATAPAGISRLSGHLSATWHGGTTDEDLTTSAARIERIQVVSREREEVAVVPAGRSAAHGGRSFAAVPESVGLRDVDTAPGGLVDSSPPGRRDTSYRGESGWLVDLRIEG